MKLKLAIILIITAAMMRLLPHYPNFTPMGAIGLAGAAWFSRKWVGMAIAFTAMFLSDLVLNNLIYAHFYEGFKVFNSWYIYAGLAAYVFIGWSALRKKVSVERVILCAVAGSAIFFLLSNFSTWSQWNLYPKTFAGLMTCYGAGLPYFLSNIAADLFYSTVLFGAYSYFTQRTLAKA